MNDFNEVSEGLIEEDIDEEAADEGPEDDDEIKKAENARMELFDWLQCIVYAIIFGIFIFVFFGRTIGVDGISMLNTLHNNDRVIMSGLFYTPKNGNIVIFRSPSDDYGAPFVKRVIAVEGQTIDINFETGDVIVDGVILDEPYIYEPTHVRSQFNGPITIPAGYIFVMGDNRNNSTDSRAERVGLIDTRLVLGRVLFVIIPGSDGYGSRDWSRIGPLLA